jgi:hypothetical protein
MKSINHHHGSIGSDANSNSNSNDNINSNSNININNNNNNNNNNNSKQTISSQAEDERYKFINSNSNKKYKLTSDKNNTLLRIQLWDAFRLTRVILGTPITEHKKISHTIQSYIQYVKVAEK